MLPALTGLIQAMRPHQWVKNLLVLASLVFAHETSELGSVRQAGMAFAVFCALASAIYLLNDLVDRESDRAHPRKCQRPIASGRVPIGLAIGAMLVLLGVAGFGSALITEAHSTPKHGAKFFVWPLAYFALNIGYTFGFKRVVIVDCICIALGFQFRVQAGSAAIDVESSRWILLCTFFFALFLAFCKRREELARSGGNSATRATMEHYTIPFLDQIIAPLAALSILTYALYTLDGDTQKWHGTKSLAFTVPIVVFGVFRYLFLIHNRGGGEDPAKLLFRDRPIVASGVLWVVTVYLIVMKR